jgi:UDP-N-acetylmuramyl pentapeptide phosphotransferase/UDP-N-acetylglucosamine-1-phosphate transferase
MGAIGFLDDYLKKVKKNKDGLREIQSNWTGWFGFNCRCYNVFSSRY